MVNMKVTGDSFEERVEKFNSFKDHLPKYVAKGVQINVADNITTMRAREETDGTLHKEWQFTHNLVTSEGDIYYANKITGRVGTSGSASSAYVDTNFASDGRLFHHDGTTTVTSSTVYGAMILGHGTNASIAETDSYDEFAVNSAANVAYDKAYDIANGNNSPTLYDSTKTITANYPIHSDADLDNSGGASDQVTWAYSWTKGDFKTHGTTKDLTGGVIVDRATNATPAATAKLLCHFNFASPFEKTANDTLKVFVNHTFEGAA